jgi:hypothetical protein
MGGWEKNEFTVVNVWQQMGRAFMEGSMHGRRFPKDFSRDLAGSRSYSGCSSKPMVL